MTVKLKYTSPKLQIHGPMKSQVKAVGNKGAKDGGTGFRHGTHLN